MQALVSNQIHAVGRRKRAIARVYLRPGSGDIIVNRRKFDDYFLTMYHRTAALRPLVIFDAKDKFDILINVTGGGKGGQAQAICLGISRAMLIENPELRRDLRSNHLLTRDARIVERKKYGQKKARKKFQFSKR